MSLAKEIVIILERGRRSDNERKEVKICRRRKEENDGFWEIIVNNG